jgi:carbonic anhydrase/acetyltransferase-like protein (isoleucine patch superfamily)
MKFIIFSLILFTATPSFAETSSRCQGEEGYYFVNYKHRNPTKGGFISNNADVQDTDDLMFIGPNVTICGSSRISGRARIFGSAEIDNSSVSDRAEISENAVIKNGAVIQENAKIRGNAVISGAVVVKGEALVTENARISNSSSEKLVTVGDKAVVTGSAKISDDVSIMGSARISGNAFLSGTFEVAGNAIVKGFTIRSSGKFTTGTLDEPDYAAIAEAKRKEDLRIESERLKAIADAEERERIRNINELDAENERIRTDEKLKADLIRFSQVKNNLIAWEQQEDDSYEELSKGGIKRAKKWGPDKHSLTFSKENCFITVEVTAGEDLGAVLYFDFTKSSNNETRSKADRGVQIKNSSVLLESEFQTLGNSSDKNAYLFEIFTGDITPSGRKEDPEHVAARADDLRFYIQHCQDR